ncbi:hypothetical protein BDN70DRAFT_937820 [Pholiota conissans]|uniref:Uncharacterized protein n=1 Tax=Pholiota conissans TaxID=109636 RepID=A0A9P6CNJ2_9AGAR|nr:hypothetical protein BDN70DRAFT_937820 [Pholiota conissans]
MLSHQQALSELAAASYTENSFLSQRRDRVVLRVMQAQIREGCSNGQCSDRDSMVPSTTASSSPNADNEETYIILRALDVTASVWLTTPPTSSSHPHNTTQQDNTLAFPLRDLRVQPMTTPDAATSTIVSTTSTIALPTSPPKTLTAPVE